MSTQILLIEDHEIMRHAIEGFVQNRGFTLWGTAATAEDALNSLREAKGSQRLPDVILVDLSLPDMTGIQFVANVVSAFPEIHCLILTAHGERCYIDQALAAGASGYLKKSAPDDIEEAVRHALAGDTFIAQED